MSSETVIDERLAEMLAGMEGVTPGPWGLFSHGSTLCIDNRGGDGRRPSIVDWPGFDQNDQPLKVNRKNAAHIARCDPDTIRSILTELQSLRSKPVASGVEVKPLEWELVEGRDEDMPKWRAVDATGLPYEVFKAWWGTRQEWGYVSLGEFFATEAEAKAAAEADYRNRILSALEPATAPVVSEPVAWVGDYRKSDGTTDYFVMLGKDGREMSLHMHRIRGRAEYEAAEINHVLTGSPKPEFEDFDLDATASPQPQPKAVTEEMVEKRRKRVSMAAVGALRKAMVERALGLSESQAILIDEVVSPLVREAVLDAMKEA